MATDLKSLEKQLASHGVCPVYLLQGAERLLVDEAAHTILARAVDDPDDSMTVTRVDLATSGTTARDVIAAAQSIGLFAGRSAVLVRAAGLLDKRSAERDLIAAYVADPNPRCTLILVADKLNGSTKLVKGVKKLKGFYSFDRLRSRDTPPWIVAEARRLGHRMDQGTARLIAELVGTGLQRLRLAIDQVSLYVGDGQPITSAAVEECLASTRAHSVFELVDAVGDRRLVPALKHLHAMQAHREPALRIMAMLNRHFRLLWQFSAAQRRGANLDEAARLIGMQTWQAKKFVGQARKFDEWALKQAYDRLYEADYRLKSTGLDDTTVMERLVMDLVGL